jgi:hypothetical protein
MWNKSIVRAKVDVHHVLISFAIYSPLCDPDAHPPSSPILYPRSPLDYGSSHGQDPDRVLLGVADGTRGAASAGAPQPGHAAWTPRFPDHVLPGRADGRPLSPLARPRWGRRLRRAKLVPRHIPRRTPRPNPHGSGPGYHPRKQPQILPWCIHSPRRGVHPSHDVQKLQGEYSLA